jgi:hypothetical protein
MLGAINPEIYDEWSDDGKDNQAAKTAVDVVMDWGDNGPADDDDDF